MSAGEIVVITGASAGVGPATACAFARRGARIGLIARGQAGLEAARQDVEALGAGVLLTAAAFSWASQSRDSKGR